MLDDGRLTDGQGIIVDFKNAIIIMTSNLGSDLILEANDTNDIKEKIQELLKMSFRPEFLNRIDEIITFTRLDKTFRPEFLNRIDEIITFTRLDKKYIAEIVRNQIAKVANRLKDRRITLDVSDEAIDYIADIGYDPQFGARPLKRAIQNYIENPLAKEMLAGKYLEGDTIKVVKEGDGLVFEK